jgi:hypothetical protein
VQEGDVVRSMEILRQQLEANITVDESKLNSLEKQRQVIESNLAAVADPDTSAAIDFNNQLAAARLLLEIESGDASYRLTHLRDYLAKNF